MTSKYCKAKGLQKAFYFTTNKISSCCRDYGNELDSTKTMLDYTNMWQQESQQLSQGIELPGCKSCWIAENKGQESFRLQVNQFQEVNDIDISVSNACNQMCSYCSPRSSSEWQNSIQTLGNFTNISASAKQNLQTMPSNVDVDYWLDQISDHLAQQSDNSTKLNLLGGEPLMQLTNLQRLLDLCNHKISIICITTNLNPPNNKFLSWVAENLPVEKLRITVSIDTCPEFNHVPRGLFDQKKFIENLEFIKQRNIQFQFSAVSSVLSMFDIDNYLRWTADNHYLTTFFTLNNPACLEPDTLPDFVKQQLAQRINGLVAPKFIIDTLSRPTTGNSLIWFEQFHYLTQYFKRVGIDPLTVNNQLFREWWNWLILKNT